MSADFHGPSVVHVAHLLSTGYNLVKFGAIGAPISLTSRIAETPQALQRAGFHGALNRNRTDDLILTMAYDEARNALWWRVCRF